MRKLSFVLLYFFCLGFRPSLLRSQTQPANPASPTASASAAAIPGALTKPQTPAEFFARARQLSDLEASGIPFHLKATYVATGDAEFTGNGTYEEWWQSKDTWRKEATLGKYRYVAIENGGDPSAYSTSAYTPLRLRQAMEAVLIHIDAPDSSSRVWQAQTKRIHGFDFTVLSGMYQCGGLAAKAQCLKLDYFTQGGVLRIASDESVSTLYNGIQSFRSLLVPRDISIANGKQPMLRISVNLLEPLPPGPNVLSDSLSSFPGLQPIINKIADSSAETARNVAAPSPQYPLTARQTRVQGTVVISAAIDDHGAVREPYVIHSAGSLLDDASLQAVRQWRYMPLIVDGKPVTVETTIAVVFALRY